MLLGILAAAPVSAQWRAPDQRPRLIQRGSQASKFSAIGAAITLSCPAFGQLFNDYDLTETASTPTITLNPNGCKAGQWIRLLPLRTGAGSFGQPTFASSATINWDASYGSAPTVDTAASMADKVSFMYGADSQWHQGAFLPDPSQQNFYAPLFNTSSNGLSCFAAGQHGLCSSEGTAPTGQASVDLLYASTANHDWTALDNNGTAKILQGGDLSTTNTARLQVADFDTGSGAPADTTSDLRGALYVTKAVTVRAAYLYTEKSATCTTEPAYELYYNTSFSSSSATLISTGNCTATATSISSVSCGVTATSVAATDYIFWEVKTAAGTCAPWLKLVYEYTMN